MEITKKLKNYFQRPKSRRDYLAEQMRLLLAGAMFPWPLSSLVRVRPAAPTPPKKSGGLKTTKKQADAGPVHPLAKKFVGEKLKYDVTFLWMVNAAEGSVTFKRDVGKGYVGKIEAKAKGLIGWVTNQRSQTLISHMSVRNINGQDRFVTNIYRWISQKGDTEYKSNHIMNFTRKKWYYRRYVNGKLVKVRTRKIKGNAPYDDLVVLAYNFRAGVYGPVQYGKTYSVTTIPFKKVSKFSFQVASKEQMAKEKKWIKQHPKAKYMVVVKIDKKIFGIKTGEAKMLGNKDLVPISAYVKDAVHFGNVYADIRQEGAGKSSPDPKPANKG